MADSVTMRVPPLVTHAQLPGWFAPPPEKNVSTWPDWSETACRVPSALRASMASHVVFAPS